MSGTPITIKREGESNARNMRKLWGHSAYQDRGGESGLLLSAYVCLWRGRVMSTCMGCLKDYEDEDLVWQGGLLCVNCKEEGESNE